MESIGEKLRKARVKKKLSVAQVSKASKIHSKVINNIEDDLWENFSSPLYARSFLKKYAEFLNLDSGELVKKYDSLYYKPSDFHSKPATTQTYIVNHHRLVFTLKIVIASIFALTSIFFIQSAIRKVLASRLWRTQKQIQQQPKAKKEVADITQKSSQQNLPPSLFPIPQGQPLQLTITAKKNSWLQVTSDGEIIYQGIMTSSNKKSWKADSYFELWIGNAGNLKFSLNGQEIIIKDAGMMKGVRIDREGVKLPGE
jgi:cytoskeletal protein RodZ